MRRKPYLWSLFKSILSALILVLIINTWFFKPVKVIGNSMFPTLQDGQQGFSSVFALNTQGLKRFDVVVVKADDDYLVKRVIGLPNETIEFNNEQLLINGQIVDQYFLNQQHVDQLKQSYIQFTADFGPITIANDEYFLMGDNRPLSIDSRFSQYGPFKEDAIISKDLYVVYPFSQFKKVGH